MVTYNLTHNRETKIGRKKHNLKTKQTQLTRKNE